MRFQSIYGHSALSSLDMRRLLSATTWRFLRIASWTVWEFRNASMPAAPSSSIREYFPKCGEDRLSRPSKRHRLFEDPVPNQRIQSFLGHNLHGSSEKLLKVDNQAGWKPGACNGAYVNQEVHIALGPRLTSGHGTEHTNIPRTMLRCNPENLVAFRPDKLSRIQQLFHLPLSYTVPNIWRVEKHWKISLRCAGCGSFIRG